MKKTELEFECRGCRSTTKHRTLKEYRRARDVPWDPDDEEDEGPPLDYSETETWSILACLGCGSVSFRREFRGISTDPDGKVVEEFSEHIVEIFPRRPFITLPKGVAGLEAILSGMPDEIRQTLVEVADAMPALPRLAAMGLRTVVDLALTDQVGDRGGFRDKLDEAVKKELIGVRQRQILDSIVEFGHASSHRGHLPSVKTVLTAFKIVAALLEALYLHPKGAAEIERQTPRRRPPQRP